jgi:nitroreductase
MDAIQAIRGRRSIRSYLGTPIERSLLEEIIEDAAHAPWTPASKPEPWIFMVIEGRGRLAEYGVRALAYAREHRPKVQGYEWADDPKFSVFHGAPVAILICGCEKNPQSLDECTRAGQNLTISAHARGLGTCWVGSPMMWLSSPAIRKELAVPESFIPRAAFAVGYPAVIPKRPVVFVPRIGWLGE